MGEGSVLSIYSNLIQTKTLGALKRRPRAVAEKQTFQIRILSRCRVWVAWGKAVCLAARYLSTARLDLCEHSRRERNTVRLSLLAAMKWSGRVSGRERKTYISQTQALPYFTLRQAGGVLRLWTCMPVCKYIRFPSWLPLKICLWVNTHTQQM